MSRKEKMFMVRCRDVLNFMEKIAPSDLAEEWDNIGLIAGSINGKVERMLVCLDVTDAALRKASSIKADLIVTHHPMIFKGLKSVSEDNVKGRQIYSTIRSGINIISAHTNLDYAEAGVNTQLASVLGLYDTALIGKGPGRVGSLKERMSFDAFVAHVKKCLKVPCVRAAGKADAGVMKAAVFSGSFDDDLDAVLLTGAEVLVTGDLKYHTALDARESNMCIIDAGHFNTERIVLPYLAAALSERFPETEVIHFKQEKDPFITY